MCVCVCACVCVHAGRGSRADGKGLSFSPGTAIFTSAVPVGHSGVMVRAQGFT